MLRASGKNAQGNSDLHSYQVRLCDILVKVAKMSAIQTTILPRTGNTKCMTVCTFVEWHFQYRGMRTA